MFARILLRLHNDLDGFVSVRFLHLLPVPTMILVVQNSLASVLYVLAKLKSTSYTTYAPNTTTKSSILHLSGPPRDRMRRWCGSKLFRDVGRVKSNGAGINDENGSANVELQTSWRERSRRDAGYTDIISTRRCV